MSIILDLMLLDDPLGDLGAFRVKVVVHQSFCHGEGHRAGWRSRSRRRADHYLVEPFAFASFSHGSARCSGTADPLTRYDSECQICRWISCREAARPVRPSI